jgi:hypothetical protein
MTMSSARAAVVAIAVLIAAHAADARDATRPASDIAEALSPGDRQAFDAAHAQLPASDWAAIRQVIADQLAALRRGDAVGAFSFAAPGIRERFGDAPAFLAMVR